MTHDEMLDALADQIEIITNGILTAYAEIDQLQAALQRSRAETAAVIDRAVHVSEQQLDGASREGMWCRGWCAGITGVTACLRALTTPDQSAALAAVLADAEARGREAGMREAAEICARLKMIWAGEKAPITSGIRHTYQNAENAILAAIPKGANK